MPEINNLVSLLRKRSAETPLFTPLVYLRDGIQDQQPITYRQLDESAQKLAGHFQSLNLKGKRILITIPQSIEYFVSFFGCLYAGVIAVPSNPPSNNRNMERLQTIIKDSGADFILADQSLYNFFKKKSKEVSENNFLIYEDLLRSEKKWTPHPVDKNDIAYLQYSSGSTGDPKGIKISHENVMTNAKGCVHALPPNLKRVVSWIPIFHDMGLISMLTYIFVGDVCCYFMNPAHFIQKPIRWFDAIHRYRGQYTVAPNFSFDLLCKKTSDSEIEKLDLSCLKSITCGSEKVRLHTIRNFYKKFGGTDLDLKAFKPSYGLAEVTLVVTTQVTGNKTKVVKKGQLSNVIPWDSELISESQTGQYIVGNGSCVPGAEVEIVHIESGNKLRDGEEGEIWVNYPGSVAQGYWELEAETHRVFFAKLKGEKQKDWLRTGDLGFKSKGELFVTGRIKEIIIVRGKNYYPEDIEYASTKAHNSLEMNSAAAFSLESDSEEKLAVVSEIKRSSWRSTDFNEVVESVRQAVTESLGIQPHYITLIKPMSLTKTTSGKIQRTVIKSQFLKGELKVLKEWSLQSASNSALKKGDKPMSAKEIEFILLIKISEKAKIPIREIDTGKSLKSYPIDSVDVVVISEEISGNLGFTINPEVFWAFNSISEVAEHLYKLSIEKMK